MEWSYGSQETHGWLRPQDWTLPSSSSSKVSLGSSTKKDKKIIASASNGREARAISLPCTEPSCFGANGFSALIETCCDECCPDLGQYCSEADCPGHEADTQHLATSSQHAHHQSISLQTDLSSQALLEALRKVCPDMSKDCNVNCYEQIHTGSASHSLDDSSTAGYSQCQSFAAANYWQDAQTIEMPNDAQTTPDSYGSVSNDYQSPLTPPQAFNHDFTQTKQITLPPPISQWTCQKGSVCCQWASCSARFDDLETLLKHLADDHLKTLELTQDGQTASAATSRLPVSNIRKVENPLDLVECLWSDCHKSANLPATSEFWQDLNANLRAPNQIKSAVSALDDIWRHLLQDHIPAIDQVKKKTDLPNVSSSCCTASSSPPICRASLPASEGQGNHVCQWNGCREEFESAALLADHLDNVHVGNGKSSYVCEWEGCERAGRVFSQRQKCVRHLIVHVNHRPFTCPHCNKRFGEAMTLNQHLRTHSKEKPFECSVCGKSFAIKGALTIHKRLHTGDKPFHCTFPGCNKSFSESSNLTKHSRLHTGLRPFICRYPGCEATFRRSDQLNRHSSRHSQDEYVDIADVKDI